MKLSLYEQETILLYNQAEDTAEVYTHDRKLMEKLTRLSKKHPEQVCKKDKHNFTVPKRCVSVREPYSAEFTFTTRLPSSFRLAETKSAPLMVVFLEE